MKVLKGGRLIDGTGAGPQPGATVVIREQRIEAVTTKPAGEWPQDAEIIDVSGMTILPGLIDCHDHMAMHGYDLARRWGIDEPQSTRTLRTAKVLEQTLAMGYTAVRDAAGLDAGFKRAIDEGLIAGPRLVVSLCIISPIGGIGDRVSPSGFSCCVPHDPLLPDGVVNSLADVRPAVRRVVRAGADVIKCATTGGASSRPEHGPRDGAFNLDEMQALTDEAHALDRRVMCHALGGRGLAHRDRGRRRFDRARLLPRRRARTARCDGGARDLFRADLCGLRFPPQIARCRISANGRTICGNTTSRACAGPSPPVSRSPPEPMPAATVTRRTRSRSSASSKPV